MFEIGKKYRLKKLKGWFEKDSEEFTVVCFGEHNIVVALVLMVKDMYLIKIF